MAYNIIIKPKAEEDWDNAVCFFNAKKYGLGFEVFAEIDDFLEILKANPLHYQKRFSEIRVIFTKKFHYGIFYTLEETTIFVHAILNAKDDIEKLTYRI